MQLLQRLTYIALLLLLLARGSASSAGTKNELQPSPPAAPQARDVAAPPPVRALLWNSPEMLRVRVWLADYFRQSRRYSSEQAQAYLAGLERLSDEEMRIWLARFEELRKRFARLNQTLAEERQWRRARAAAQQTQYSLNAARLANAESVKAAKAQHRLDRERAYAQRFAQQQAASRDVSLRARRARPDTFAVLHYLDTLEIREDLRRLADKGD